MTTEDAVSEALAGQLFNLMTDFAQGLYDGRSDDEARAAFKKVGEWLGEQLVHAEQRGREWLMLELLECQDALASTESGWQEAVRMKREAEDERDATLARAEQAEAEAAALRQALTEVDTVSGKHGSFQCLAGPIARAALDATQGVKA